MKKYFEVLRRCPLFDGITDQNLTSLLACLGAKVKKYNKKSTVIEEGEPAKYVGILLSGSAQIIRTDYYGNRTIIAGIAPSEMFCESFACAGLSAVPVTIIATEPCEILLTECNKILTPCSESCDFHRQMIMNFMKILALKNIMFHRKIEITSKRTTREKLMTYLMLHAKSAKSNSFSIPFDRQELADYLEVDRSGLSAEISKLRNEGFIECRKNRFKLLKKD